MKGVAEFVCGAAAGAGLALVALGLSGGTVAADAAPVGDWLELNLGHSAWLFALVLTLYAANLHRLSRLLAGGPDLKVVVKLDQLRRLDQPVRGYRGHMDGRRHAQRSAGGPW